MTNMTEQTKPPSTWERFKKWVGCASCIKATLTSFKVVLATVGPSAIAIAQAMSYHPSELEKGIATVTTILGAILIVMDKTSAAMVKDAKDIEGVQVHVDTMDTNTPKSVVNLAVGPMSDVFPMIGGPRQPSDHLDAEGSVTTEELPPPVPTSSGGDYKTLS